MKKEEIEALADADYDAMIERTGGNPNVRFMISGLSEMLGVMLMEQNMNVEEIRMFRDEMTIMINRMLEDIP